MKYTFEIMKEYEDAFMGISVYSVSEDKKLMVDFVALEELEDAQKEIDEAYKRGLTDAWECMKKIAFSEKPRDMRDFFGHTTFGGILTGYTATEAIEKLKAYEEKQKADDEIKVGDEVCYIDKMRKDAGIVTWRRYDEIYIMWDDGSSSRNKVNDYRKTGRHFDIDKLLEAMNE